MKHQSEAPEWFRYKVGLITANNAKRVYTRYQTLLKKPGFFVKSVVPLILRYHNFNPAAALKLWKCMENKNASHCNQKSVRD